MKKLFPTRFTIGPITVTGRRRRNDTRRRRRSTGGVVQDRTGRYIGIHLDRNRERRGIARREQEWVEESDGTALPTDGVDTIHGNPGLVSD